jgi:hypothetical protein
MSVFNVNEKRIADYIQAKRPPVELRDQLDLGYSFKNNEVILFEVRPQWNDESKMNEYPFARCKYVKTQQIWKIYWMRASGQWELYEPNPTVTDIDSFIETVESDAHSCFFG